MNNAKDVRITQKLNGEHTLELTLPRTDPKWTYVQPDNFIRVNRDLYIIRTTDEIRGEDGRLLSNIQCEHVFFELLDHYLYDAERDLNAKEYIGKSAQFMLDDILAGTRFKADATRLSGLHDLWLEDATAVKGVKEVAALWNAEFTCAGLPDADGKFLITFYDEIGTDNGVTVEYRENLKSIRKRTDAKGVVTRLYVYGKDGLGIRGASQNTADTAYIDSPNIGDYPRPKASFVKFNDITDQDELYEKGVEYLSQIDTPRITYEVRGLIDNVALGDTITVKDEGLGVDVKVRIVEYEYYPFEKRLPNVVLANRRDTIEDYLARLNDVKRTVENVTSRGRVNAHWLDGIINAMTTQIKASGSFANAEVIDGSGILFENNNANSPDYGALYLGPGIFAIANEKTSAGEWNWRTFGTGKGFDADLINAGIINTSLIRILSSKDKPVLDIEGDTIRIRDKSGNVRVTLGQYAQGLFGIEIENGEIYSTLIRTGAKSSNTYIELNPDGNFSAFNNGKRIVFIQASSNDGRITLGDQYFSDKAELTASFDVTLGSNIYRCIGLLSSLDTDGVHISAGSGSDITLLKNGDVLINAGSTEITIGANGHIDIGRPTDWTDVRIFGNLEVRGTINGN